MKTFLTSLLLAALLPLTAHAQERTQTVRGRVLDAESHFPVFAASVLVQPTDSAGQGRISGATDEDGRFTLSNVPVGRQVIIVAAIGYQPLTTAPQVVISGKELVLDLELQPSVSELKEVEVKAASADKGRVNNDMAVLSARTFDSELAARFAGSRNDPARMATNFAGVSGANDGRNDIVIRGNAPSGLLWRLDGIDIPSPNHFSSFGSTGGPVSMLNNNVLAKSDFITGAWPGMYGNALSGVFDLTMRNGNDQKHEFLGQIGFNGFEFGAEGPINKAAHSSYLIDYRYSTLEVFKQLGMNFGTGSAVPKYQDLSFKVNLPTSKAGHFTVFGFGGNSSIDLLGSETDFTKVNENDLYGNESQDIFNRSESGVVGASHAYFFNDRLSYKLTLAYAHQRDHTDVDSLRWSDGTGDQIHLLGRTGVFNTSNQVDKLLAHLQLRDKLNARNTLQAGLIAEHDDASFYKRYFRQRDTTAFWDTLQNGNGTLWLLQAYVLWKHHFTDDVFSTLGVHGQYHDLSNSRSLEPRAGISWRLNTRSTLSAAYGLHSQTQLPTTYFVTTPDGRPTSNRDLGFTRAHHVVLAYQRSLWPQWNAKLEAYYQYLFDVPVERTPSNFSMLNTGADFTTPNEDGLVNTGTGRNYGLELTVERTYEKGFYALFTTSLFNSEYRGSDGVWRNTVYNGNYVINALAGKEWKLGPHNNSLALDLKGTWAGGRRYTPIDLSASLANGTDTRFEDRAFSAQYSAYFRADVKLMYRIQRKHSTHEFGIDLQNVTGNKNVYATYFDDRSRKVVTEYQLGFFPIPQYRILF